MDFPRYGEWNPFIRSIEGMPSEGATIKVKIQPPGGKGMTFSPVILRQQSNRELRWKGKLFLPGIFDGEHYFRLESEGAGSTTLVHGERFSGVLVPLLRGSLDRNTKSGFEAMNRALKRRVEQVASHDLPLES